MLVSVAGPMFRRGLIMRVHTAFLSVVALLATSTALAQDQVAPTPEQTRELHSTIPYTSAAIRVFVETEFAKSNIAPGTEPVIAILMRDLAKDGSGGFRIGPEDLDYTFEYRRVGEDVQIHKVGR